MQHKYKKLILTMLTSGLAIVVNVLIQFILTPYITKTVGVESYGFVSLAKEFMEYAAIVTAALNSFAARYIVIEYHNENYDKANQYFSSVFYGNIMLGSVIAIVSGFIIIFLDKILHIPVGIVNDVKWLFTFAALTSFLTAIFSVFSAAGYIKNKLDLVGLFKSLALCVEAIILILMYHFLEAKIFYIGVGFIAMSLIIGVSNWWISEKYTKELTVKLKFFDWTSVKNLLSAGIWTTLNSLGGILNSGLDLLVCDLMLSATQMGQLALAKVFSTIFASLFAVVGQAFHPIFLKSYAKNDKRELLKDLFLSMKVSGMFSNIVFAGFFAFGLAYYKLWIPNEDIQLIYVITLINNMIVIPGGPMQPLYYIYVLTVKKKFPTLMTIFGGVFNVISMYFLIKYTNLGLYAVVGTTVFVMFVINFITNPLYMAHSLNLPLTTFYPNIIRNLLSCGTLMLVFKAIAMLRKPDDWLTLIATAAVCAVIGIFLHILIVGNKEEKQKIFGYLKRKI